MGVAEKEPKHYNENAPLGEAIQDAVAMADVLARWPEGLPALAEVALVGGEKPTVEQLVNSEGPLTLKIDLEKKPVPLGVMHGLCALMWARPKDAPLHVDLSKCKLGAEGLSALARGLTPALASLTLDGSDITNKGGNSAGVRRLCQALAEGCAPELAELRCVASARSLAAFVPSF